MNTIERFNEHIMGTYGRYPVVLESGSGRQAVDEDGKKYIDFGSGIGTNSLGYCSGEWADAVCAQVRKLQHNSNYYYTKVQADFAGMLAAASGMENMFFGNSGAEANECAIKLARKYSFDKYGEKRGRDRQTIVTLVNSFHGRTVTTLSATGQEVFHNYFFPFTGGFVHARANDIEDLLSKTDDSVCAIMFEYVQGEGGVVPLEQSFVDKIFEIAEKNDILTITDEVQTGVGRTGKFLAGEHFGHKADIITLAKGIAGGLPMGVCLAGKKCSGVLTAGTHGSTFGGNPVCCAGGVEVLKKAASPEFLAEVTKKGEYFREKLSTISEVDGVDGLGLMIGIRLKTKNSADTAKAALENGLLVLTAKDKLRLLPPLTVTYEEIDEGIEILRKILG